MRRLTLMLLMLCGSGLSQAADRPEGPVDAAQCITCHSETQPVLVEAWQTSGHGANNVSCVSCHGALHDDGVMARQGNACIDCHGGDRAPAVHSYTTSKHGVLVTLESAEWDWTQPLRAANYRAPNCAYCHLHAGEHDTRRLIANVNDPIADEQSHDATKAVCYDCHAPRYIGRQDQTGQRMLEIARMKWREGKSLVDAARTHYTAEQLSDALQRLAGMQAHVMNVRLGIAHQSPDYQWWHGQPALDGDLLRIKGELSRLSRESRQQEEVNLVPSSSSVNE